MSAAYDLGDLTLDCGGVLPDARLVYETYGQLNSDRSNAIVFPTAYMGRHTDNEWLIGRVLALDPRKYFIIVPNMLGNGVSSSPSNTPAPFDGPRFPPITFHDQVRAQHRLVEREFGITRLAAVVGWSMGAAQAFHWAVDYPQMVARVFAFCGAARISEHNIVFLEGEKAALKADPVYADGSYATQPLVGLRAAARVHSAWAYGQPFYRDKLYTTLGYADREDFLVRFWETLFTEGRDANDVLSMIDTWQHGDVGTAAGADGDYRRALASITARCLVLAADYDLYFVPDDEINEVTYLRHGEFQLIRSLWGHSAGAGLNAQDSDFVGAALQNFLVSEATPDDFQASLEDEDDDDGRSASRSAGCRREAGTP